MVIKTNSRLLENIDINLFNLIHAIEVSNEAEPEDQELLDIIRTRLMSRLSKRIDKKTYLVKDTGGIRYFPNGVCRTRSSDWNRFVTDGYASINLDPYEEVHKEATPKDEVRAKIRHMTKHAVWYGAACAATAKRVFTQCEDDVTTKLRDNPRFNTVADICDARDRAASLSHTIISDKLFDDKNIFIVHRTVANNMAKPITETFYLEKRLTEPLIRCAEQVGEASTIVAIINNHISNELRRVDNTWRYWCSGSGSVKLAEYRSFTRPDKDENFISNLEKLISMLSRLSKETQWLEMNTTQIQTKLQDILTYAEPKSSVYKYDYGIDGYRRYGESRLCIPRIKRFPLNYAVKIWTKDSSEYLMNAISLAEKSFRKAASHDVFMLVKKEINNVISRLETKDFTLHFNEELGSIYEAFAPTEASRIEDRKTGWLIKKESLEELREIFQVNDEMKAIYRSLTGLK